MNERFFQRFACRFTVAALAMFALLATPGIGFADENEGDGKLAAIGGLSAAHMYTTYVAIGSVADAFGHDVYKTEQVQDIMSGMVGMIDTLKKQLLLVQENCEDKADKDFIDDTIQIYTLLQEEARQLSKFSKSRDKADHRAFEKARTTVWPRIQKVLGIGGE